MMSDARGFGAGARRALVRADISCSPIGFGGSRLHHLVRFQDRQDILETAYGCGINYFDVAPIYGFGLAERALGGFLKQRAAERERLVVATKWGLPDAAWTDLVPARGLRGAAAAEALRRKTFGAPDRPELTPALLRRSLEGSLRRLGTDYVDILWMHEPDPTRLPDPAAIIETLGRLRAQGKLRFAGVAGYRGHVGPTIAAFAPVTPQDWPLLQQCDEKSWTTDAVPDATFGAISQEAQRRNAPRVNASTAGDRLRAALARRDRGVVLVSTTRADHLRQIAEHAGAM